MSENVLQAEGTPVQGLEQIYIGAVLYNCTDSLHSSYRITIQFDHFPCIFSFSLLQTRTMDKEIVKLYKEGKMDKLRSTVKGQTVGSVSIRLLLLYYY